MHILKELRTSKGVSQQTVAEACGVKRETVCLIETGVNNPSVKLAKRLADYFGVEWPIFFSADVN